MLNLSAVHIDWRLQVACVVSELKGRNDWYTREALASAKELAQKLGSRDLTEALLALR